MSDRKARSLLFDFDYTLDKIVNGTTKAVLAHDITAYLAYKIYSDNPIYFQIGAGPTVKLLSDGPKDFAGVAAGAALYVGPGYSGRLIDVGLHLGYAITKVTDYELPDGFYLSSYSLTTNIAYHF